MDSNELTTIVLAAGSSTRMGKSKQQLPVGNGTLLEHTIRCAVDSSQQNILVVLGAHAHQHQALIQHLPVTISVNIDWVMGMGNSLKFGVKKTLALWPDTQGLLVLVCDQPLLTATHLSTLTNTWLTRQPMAVASEYKSVAGVPAIFDRGVFQDLLSIRNPAGARELLLKWDAEVVRVPFAGGEIDLDTPEDYKSFLSGVDLV
jgi:molybdenum cofactor cytidylyltransferase